MSSLSQVAACANTTHPVGVVGLLVVLAAVLEPQLLLPTLTIFLRNIAAFHLLSRFLCLLLQLELVLRLVPGTALLILLLLILHQLLKHV